MPVRIRCPKISSMFLYAENMGVQALLSKLKQASVNILNDNDRSAAICMLELVRYPRVYVTTGRPRRRSCGGVALSTSQGPR